MHLTTHSNYFNHAHLVAVRCEASEATPEVAAVSEATCYMYWHWERLPFGNNQAQLFVWHSIVLQLAAASVEYMQLRTLCHIATGPALVEDLSLASSSITWLKASNLRTCTPCSQAHLYCILSHKRPSPWKRPPPPVLMTLWFTYICVMHTNGLSV